VRHDLANLGIRPRLPAAPPSDVVARPLAWSLLSGDGHLWSSVAKDNEDAGMNISYDLEFDMDSFLTDLERRQHARKRIRLEEVRKEVRRMKSERKHRNDRLDD
jgi:hypothetical protein